MLFLCCCSYSCFRDKNCWRRGSHAAFHTLSSEAGDQVSISPTFHTRLFCTKVSHEAFLSLHLRFELFWRKIIGTNALLKYWWNWPQDKFGNLSMWWITHLTQLCLDRGSLHGLPGRRRGRRGHRHPRRTQHGSFRRRRGRDGRGKVYCSPELQQSWYG